jgi:membrane-associated protein
MVAWWVGARGLSQARLERWFGGEGGANRGIERVMAGFRRWGPAFLMVNRFMPGVRAFFFVAAGMARLPALWVALYSAVSAGAWNALLLLAGYFVGDNLEQLQALLSTMLRSLGSSWVLCTMGPGCLVAQPLQPVAN